MYTVEIRSSCIVLHNYHYGDNERLERMLSLWDKQRHKFYSVARYYDNINKDLYVCRGLDMWIILPSFAKDIVSYTRPDNFEQTGQILLNTQPRDERQIEAIKFCVGAEQYHQNREATQIHLNIVTGGGKSFIAVFCFAFYSVKSIVITSSVSWLKQWKDKILEYTNLRVDEIYLISGAASIEKLFNGSIDRRRIKFYLATHSTLNMYGKNNGWDKLRKLFQDLKIGIKIYDEAHLYFDNICRIDFFTNVWKTYYLTATPSKSDFMQNKIYQRCFSTVPKINLFDEVNDPHTSYLAILFNSRPTAFDIQKCSNANQYGFSIIEYINYFSQTEIYYKLLQIVLVHCFADMNQDERVLIYIGKNDVIMNTYYWLRYHYYNISIGIYTSLVKEDKQTQLESTIILTTSKSAGVLLDIPKLKKVVIFCEPFNSPVLAQQILGRTRNKDTEMIELVDCGFQRIQEWYLNKKRNVYHKYATQVNEVSYTEAELNAALLDIERQQREKLEAKKPLLKQVVDIVNK